MEGIDNFEMKKGDDDSRDYLSPFMSLGWRFTRSSATGSIATDNPMAIYRGDLMESSSCSPASMVDSFCPTVSDQLITSQNLVFCDINVLNNAGSFNATAMEGTLDMGWNPPNPILRGDMSLPTSSSMLPQSLSQIPTDLGFIERGARFSIFSEEIFGDMLNSFSIPGSMSQYTRGVAPMQRPVSVFPGIRLNSIFGGQAQENETNVVKGTKDVSLPIEHGTSGGSPNSGRKTESFIRSCHEANQVQCESGNELVDAEFSSGGNQADPSLLEGTGQGTLAKGRGSKKRKKIGQDTEPHQVKTATDSIEPTSHNSGIRKKGDQNPASTANKPNGKHGKLGPQASDSLKQEYIHVRAKRGQATNTHSLAERVRREKISERMKYLQDLVPGCSKVTGKAVMLDEIINYVQSLQRQVEFLSMKLASLNPRLDFEIEGITGKDILQSQAGTSSGLGFLSEMSLCYPPLRLSQPGTIQADLPGIGTSSDALRRTISSHMTAMSDGNKDSTSQLPDVWEDDLHNIVQKAAHASRQFRT